VERGSSAGELLRVIGRGAKLEERQDGEKLLRIRIAAEVDGVRSEYTITYSRRGADNAAEGYAYASANAPGGREADAKRFSALVKALTGEKPGVYRKKNGQINRVLRGTSGGLRPLRRVSGCHHEVARGDGAVMEELKKVF
jgi:hypothetical protein